MLSGVLAMEEAVKPSPSDVTVSSFIKSGTTWFKALTFTIVHRSEYAFSSHPLLKCNLHDCVPIMESIMQYEMINILKPFHLLEFSELVCSYSQLPESIKVSKCLYICREPKDVLVSLWHSNKKFEWIETHFPFDQQFEFFCKGQTPYGPVWDHVLEYYTESLRNSDKILLSKYEEMLKDPKDVITNIAKFLGSPFSEEELKNGVVKEIIEFCSFNKLKDYDVNKYGIGNETNDHFFRKGVVGDWQNYMTTEMATKLDQISKEKFHNSGFTYGIASINVDQQQ